ncbi:chemotaxis protein CheA [Paenibacillus sp. TRM 82003]|nr:chemotaxis protein CheA [Paenibacillus sp. TRM 82003]
MNRSELMAAFLAEADEQLQQLEQGILQLEREGQSDRTIQELFRSAHTLKGSSAAMGFEPMKHLTHEMENVLDRIRRYEMNVTHACIDVLFECLDSLGTLKDEIEATGAAALPTDGVVAKLRALAELNDGVVEKSPTGESSLLRFALTEEEKLAAAQARAEGKRPVICEIEFASACEMKLARAYIVHNELSDGGQVLAVVPGLDQIAEDGGCSTISFLLATNDDVLEVERKLKGLHDIAKAAVATVRAEDWELLAGSASSAPKAGGKAGADGEESASVQAGVIVAGKAAGHAEHAARKGEPVKKSGQTIRVDVERLENLMNLVGELVIDQTRIAQVSGVLRDSRHADEAIDDLEQISNHIARVVSELQETVMKTRMLPIEQLFNRFPRMIRDLSQTLGKEVELTIVGKETELDRTVIEEIGDPLIHLIRNAVDHGIEAESVRLAAEKPTKGTVRLAAMHQENQVVITIEDDGAGISAEKLKRSAVNKGLLPEAAADALTEQEALQLIFEAGFSTSATISDVSGRGVGMDIVRSHIQKLNGIIDVETKAGAGTKFTIKLPLTLAILRGLLIQLNERTYALPMTSVIEIVRIPKHEIYSVKGQAVVKIREKVLPIAWLHDHFHIPRRKQKSQNVFVVIVGAAEKRLGLIVDDLIGNQEIVVKSIGSYVGKVEGVSGATILGDGSVALILDIAGVFKLSSAQKSIYYEPADTSAESVV